MLSDLRSLAVTDGPNNGDSVEYVACMKIGAKQCESLFKDARAAGFDVTHDVSLKESTDMWRGTSTDAVSEVIEIRKGVVTYKRFELCPNRG